MNHTSFIVGSKIDIKILEAFQEVELLMMLVFLHLVCFRQALQQMEKVTKDLKLEVQTLREGVGARDDALSLMREEVDRSVVVLANAAENREVLYCLGAHFFLPQL